MLLLTTPQTQLLFFSFGIQEYGIPERVRSDQGLEFIKIAVFMLQEKGVDSRAHITGRSVHNRRIERFWRELWQGCSNTYCRLFQHMELDGILDVDSETHLLALHLMYLPRIQCSLDRFQLAISHRPMRTEQNYTPMQLWISGQVLDPKMKLTEQETSYGIDHVILDLLFNDDEDSLVEPPLRNVPDVLQAPISEILEQTVAYPHDISSFIDICHVIVSL